MSSAVANGRVPSNKGFLGTLMDELVCVPCWLASGIQVLALQSSYDEMLGRMLMDNLGVSEQMGDIAGKTLLLVGTSSAAQAVVRMI